MHAEEIYCKYEAGSVLYTSFVENSMIVYQNKKYERMR